MSLLPSRRDRTRKNGSDALPPRCRALFARKHASLIGIVAAFLIVSTITGSYIDFDCLDALMDFPGGFAWFLAQFMPDEEAFEASERIVTQLIATILDAIAAGALAALASLLLAVVGSRVSGVGGPVQMVIRAFATIMRNIPTVAWGFILLFSFKQAEFTGFLALFLKSVGFLTRAFMETIDEVDPRTIEALKATGATKGHLVVHGVLPSAIPQLASWVLYMIETNFRDATLVGMLTGTGIGFVFNWYYRSFEYPTAGLVIICIAVGVLATEAVSNFVRRKIEAPDGVAGPIERTRSGKLRTRTRTKSNTYLGALAFFLAFMTVFTFARMDYGTAHLPSAAADLIEYFGIMFLDPYLEHYSFAEMAAGLGITLSIAALVTLGGVVIALPLSLLAASNLSNRRLSNALKMVLAVARAVPTVIWVLVFTVAIGLGPEAAIVGMMFHTVSFLTKAFSEAFEETDEGIMDALKATGASWWHRIACGMIPEKLSEILSWAFIRFENNFIGAVTVGAIAGSGGIGYQLYMVSNYMFNWHEMGYIIYMCLVVSIVFELISTRLRKRFISR